MPVPSLCSVSPQGKQGQGEAQEYLLKAVLGGIFFFFKLPKSFKSPILLYRMPLLKLDLLGKLATQSKGVKQVGKKNSYLFFYFRSTLSSLDLAGNEMKVFKKTI